MGNLPVDQNGKVVKVNAFPGHNLVIGALGCFILWFGWYGFNGAAATSVEQAWRSIFLTDDGGAGCRDGYVFDFYLDQVWQAGCLDVL